MDIPHNPIADYGYTPRTTFWSDFSIAERFGASAVKDTYNRAMSEWQTNYIYLTELVMVLNHKIWQHYKSNQQLADVYNDLYARENLLGDELAYFYDTTD